MCGFRERDIGDKLFMLAGICIGAAGTFFFVSLFVWATISVWWCIFDKTSMGECGHNSHKPRVEQIK